MDGIFIPMELQQIEELNNTESMVLAIYRYYTINGDLHCCALKNEDICKMVRLKDESNLRRIKKHLKELGYIRTDGGVRVIYLGVQGGQISPNREDLNVPQGGQISPKRRTNKSKKEDINVPHKEEEKKEIRKKEGMTNFDLLIDKLPSEYKTPERIDYIKDNFMDGLNKANFNESGSFDLCLTKIKSLLTTNCPMDYHIEKPEPKSDTVDVL